MNRYVQNIDNFLESVTCCLKEENALDSILAINGKIKIKINEDQTEIIGHNIDLVRHFGEATIQAIEEERYSRR